MTSPIPEPENSENDNFPNRGTWVPPEEPKIPLRGTPEYEKMMEGREDQTEAGQQFLRDIARMAEQDED